MPTLGKHRREAVQRADALDGRPSLKDTDAMLVAIRETNGIHGVLNVAELLARRDRINAHLIGVAERRKPANDRLTTAEREAVHENTRRRLRALTKRRLHQTLGRAVYWSTDAALGSLTSVLAHETRRRTPRLILLAANEASTSRRRDAQSVLRTVNALNTPVLVVPSHQDLLPTRVLVATDFSAASKRAALAALSVMGPRGRLILVHVEPGTEPDPRSHSPRRDATAQRVARHFRELCGELEAEVQRHPRASRPHTTVKETLLLRGDPASVILDCAAQRKSDLLVLGTRPLTKSGAMPRKSVTMSVLVNCGCAVLVAHS
jgi:nucleotide-binding universal stress UspA family protein